MAYSTFSERVINGCPVDWAYWYRLKSFTPAQGASLAHRINPLRVKKSTDLEHIQAEFKEPIDHLELELSGISTSWTLTDLVIFLGDNAPEGMICKVRNQLRKTLINLLHQLMVVPPKPVILEVINTEPASKIKPRNTTRGNETLDLLHTALDELETQNSKTPSHSELVAFVLGDDFKHPNIQEYLDAGKNIPIERRKLSLTNGRVLDAAGITRRYKDNIYP
ncbi:MAG: hypothetical protein ACXW1W_01275 [Methylococcaceae bacterium]